MAVGRTVEQRFWSKVAKTESCWLWTGAISDTGYGAFRGQSRNISAHRFSYELNVGRIPDGLHLDHLCRVRHCVNPSHLEPVTCGENVRRGSWATKTHCAQGHLRTAENTYIRPDNGRRMCLVCSRARAFARWSDRQQRGRRA